MLVAAVAELALNTPLALPSPPRGTAPPQHVFPWTPDQGQQTIDTVNLLLRAWREDYPGQTD